MQGKNTKPKKEERKPKIPEVGDALLARQIKKALIERGKVRIIGAGLLIIAKRKARKGYNPFTKKYQMFPESLSLKFTTTSDVERNMKNWKIK